MSRRDDEEELLRSVALQNAQSILLARQRAEEELIQAKEALELRTKELAHSLAMMRATLESSADGILVTDGDGRVSVFNEKFCEMWGVPREILDTREHRRILEVTSRAFEDPPQFLARIDEIYASSPPESLDLLELADGRVFERFTRTQLVEEREVGRVWSFRDVTERKRAEEVIAERARLAMLGADVGAAFAKGDTLRETLRRCVQALVDRLGAALARVWTVNTAEHVLELQASAGMYTHLDGPHSHVPIGELEIGLIAEERKPHLTNQVVGDPRVHDQEWARREGMVSFAGYPLVVEDRIVGVVALFARTPLTDSVLEAIGAVADIIAVGMRRKQIEEERQGLLERAERARALAEATSRAKDEFLATVSHELRTPLNSMLGWTRLLQSGSLDDETRKRAVETIDRNARSQAQLIEDLLDVSRVISGKLRLDVRDDVALSQVVEAAIEVVRPAADAKQIRVQSVLDPRAGPVAGDPERLKQVFWNLLSNAVKFTPKGGRVHVRLERINSHVEVAVADTGAGIGPEFLPLVFDPFRQADATPARRHGGLGLGLAIVRTLVELHGGSIYAESAGEGQGATFTVTLPLVPIARMLADPSRAHPRARTDDAGPVLDEPVFLTGLRVLVVDDEADARDLVSVALSQCDADVETAGSVAEAVKVFGRRPPDLLISDIGMPGEDGFALIKRLRSLPPEEGGTVPAIALTAYARVEDRLRVLSAGYQMHVPKPVEPAELVATVASLTGRFEKRRPR